MPNLAELLISIDGRNLSEDEYKAHENNAGMGIEYIVSGMRSISNLMFWAASNDQYADAKSDMQNVGLLISANMEILEKMIEIESCAMFKLCKDK